MRRAARVTLFVHDRSGRLEAMPDLELFHALLAQVPLVTRNPDGSRTLVFDLPDPASVLEGAADGPEEAPTERLKAQFSAAADMARMLGLPLTAALADSAEIVLENEVTGGSLRPGG